MDKELGARELSEGCWGDVISSRTLCNGVYMYNNEGHGGVVVDTNVKRKLRCFKEGSNPFVAFEEDCMAPIVLYVYFREIHTLEYYRETSLDYTEEGYKLWLRKRKCVLERSLECYNPYFLVYFNNDKKWSEHYKPEYDRHK